MKDDWGMETNSLYERLCTYCRSDAYPFHMPGHKRQLGTLTDPFTFDITEIDGFDNLHHAEGILKESMERAARFYGTARTYYLINGSTCGILAAIGACAPEGKLLLARNSHKAAYHAVCLNRLEAVYLYPQKGPGDCAGPILPEDVAAALERDPGIRAVFLTSPTYEGMVSDVAAIAEIAHGCGIPLIVDEAHGAHFGMHPIFPESAVKLGADLVIQSLHKTLPSLTQTALLHVNSALADEEKLGEMLGIYQSSSPSYVLMAGIDQCIRLLEQQGDRLFEVFARNLTQFYKKTETLRKLELLRTDDPSKILISGSKIGLTGREISDLLRSRYHLELEMEAVTYALALTSVGDSEEGFNRLAQALLDLEGELSPEKELRPFFWQNSRPAAADLTVWEARNAQRERILLRESVGRRSAEFIYLYPPGIPLAIPGETMEEELLCQLLECKALGYSLQGMEDYSMEYLWVVKE